MNMNRIRKQHTALWMRRGIAALCLLVGAVGLLLPLVPGIPLLIVGMLLLRRRQSAPPRGSGLSLPDRMQLAFWQLCRSLTQTLQRRRVSAAGSSRGSSSALRAPHGAGPSQPTR
jgi:hypothetical protein